MDASDSSKFIKSS